MKWGEISNEDSIAHVHVHVHDVCMYVHVVALPRDIKKPIMYMYMYRSINQTCFKTILYT